MESIVVKIDTAHTASSCSYGYRDTHAHVVLQDVEVIALYAAQRSGYGDNRIYFYAQATNGVWYRLLKKDNPHISFPIAGSQVMPWGEWCLSGTGVTYRKYIRRTSECPASNMKYKRVPCALASVAASIEEVSVTLDDDEPFI